MKKSLPPSRWGDRIMIAGEKLEHAQILNKDFRKFLKEKSKIMFLLLLILHTLKQIKRGHTLIHF